MQILKFPEFQGKDYILKSILSTCLPFHKGNLFFAQDFIHRRAADPPGLQIHTGRRRKKGTIGFPAFREYEAIHSSSFLRGGNGIPIVKSFLFDEPRSLEILTEYF